MTIEDMRDRKGLMALIARNMPNVPSVLADKILGSRWLAEHDRQVAERAWDEAIQHQWAHRPIGNRSPHNPHRAAKEEQK